jgi:hypothetical protein
METILIEEWALIDNPLTGQTHLQGKVYSHPTYRDGIVVVTSPIIGGNAKEKIVNTFSGSHYLLGKVNEDYEKMFPDAEARVLKQIQMMEIANHAQSN